MEMHKFSLGSEELKVFELISQDLIYFLNIEQVSYLSIFVLDEKKNLIPLHVRRLVGWSVGPFKKRVVLAFTRCNWQPFVSISNHFCFATTCCNVWLCGPLVTGFFESRVYVLMSRPGGKKESFCIRWLSKKTLHFSFLFFFR